ncbi:MAG: 4-hydroxy-3-methylbut-2-enyl diphosphate reductase, partial [Chloroflexota bacterium]
MQTEKAAELGFCTGVRRAINMLQKAARGSGSLATLGPVVHNQRVAEALRQYGVEAVDSLEELEEGTVAIRSHGVSPSVVEEMKARGLSIV